MTIAKKEDVQKVRAMMRELMDLYGEGTAIYLAAQLREAKEALGKAEEEIERLGAMVMEDGRLLIAAVNRDPAQGYYDENAPYSFKAINDRCELARFFNYHQGVEHAE